MLNKNIRKLNNILFLFLHEIMGGFLCNEVNLAGTFHAVPKIVSAIKIGVCKNVHYIEIFL